MRGDLLSSSGVQQRRCRSPGWLIHRGALVCGRCRSNSNESIHSAPQSTPGVALITLNSVRQNPLNLDIYPRTQT